MAYGDYENVLNRLRQGIRRVESGGNYEALGPEISRKSGKDRAYGVYQVMGSNIPSWTEMAIGRRLTPLEFLHNPLAQEAVFDHQMMRNLQKYGTPEDAASVWFSGRPLAQATRAGAHDVNMPVQQYVQKALGAPVLEAGIQVAGGDEDFFKKLQQRKSSAFETPQEAPAAQNASPDFFEKFRQRTPVHMDAPSVVPSAPTLPQSPVVEMPRQGDAPAPKPEDVWGGGMEYLNAVSAGAARPIYSAMSGYSPEQIAAARQSYEEQYPGRSLAANVAGGMTQGALLGTVAPYAAAGLAGTRAMQAMPWAARALETLSTFRPGYSGPYPSGGYLATPGVGGSALRAAGGAAGGAGQAALNVGVNPDVPASQQIMTGAGLGAIATPLAKAAFGEHSPSFAPRIEEPIREIGKMARDKYGISLMPWQLSNMPEEAAVSTKMLTPEKAVKQAKEFGEAWGKTFSHSGDFTPASIGNSITRIGNDMDTLAQSTRIDMTTRGLGRQFQRDLIDVVNEITSDVADPADQAKLLKVIQNLDNKMMEKPLRGEVIQSLTQKDGMIDRNISPKTNSLYKYYNARLKELVYDTFHRADPSTAAAWDAAKQEYKAALIAMKGATDAGMLDPTVVAKQAAKVRAGGSMAELAQIGRQMFPVSQKGAPGVPIPNEPKGLGGFFAQHPILGTSLGATIPTAISLIPEFGPKALSAIGFSPMAAAGTAAGLTAAGYAGKYGFEAAKKAMLSSPTTQNLIMSGKLENIPNVLYGPTMRGGMQAGMEEHRQRRRK